MIKRFFIGFSILLFFSYNFIFSEEEEVNKAEPAEPELVLPSVVLEIEDLSIESIEVVLPVEDELMPPEREVPLPEEEEIIILEPEPDVTLPDYSILQIPASASSFMAEAVLGAGLLNNIISRISFYKLGESPRYKLLFNHEVLDGFAFREPGKGFSERDDSLDASVKWDYAKFDTEISANFMESEKGLQNNSDFFSHICRFIDSSADLNYMPLDVFKLNGRLNFGFSEMRLTGNAEYPHESPYPPAEIKAEAELGSEFLFKPVTFGIESRYKYRTLPGSNDYNLHRLFIGTSLAVELPYFFMFSGSGGYANHFNDFWSIPFKLSVSGDLFNSISMNLQGGYRIVEYDMDYVWINYEYSNTPSALTLTDNYGWFTDMLVKMNLENFIIISLGLGFSENKSLLDYEDIPDPATGLFEIQSQEDILFKGDLGLRINFTKWFYLDAKTSCAFALNSKIDPYADVLVEGFATEEKGNFGGNFSMLCKTDFNKQIDPPVFDIAFFYKISDNVRVIGEGHDLLSPLLENDRYRLAPYIEPGIRGTIKIHISF